MAAYRAAPWIKVFHRKTPCSCVTFRSDRFLSQEPEVATVQAIPKGQINIPKKKKRDSLSILKALASTVEPVRGPTYTELDDPNYLFSFNDKDQLAKSKASGQRTARYFVNKYRNAFDHDDAAPFVQAFQPEDLVYKHTTPCEEAIRERIQKREVNNAAEVYLKMKQQGLEVSEAVKLELLELLCYFNSTNAPEQKLSLETYYDFRQRKELPERPVVKAEDVFEDLAEKTVDAHNWLLQNHIKSSKTKRALDLYKQMKDKHIPCYRNTYHELLKAAKLFVMKYPNVEDCFKEFLDKMAEEGHRHDLDTVKCVLKGLPLSSQVFEMLPKIMTDLKALDKEPDYQTWCIILETINRSLNRVNVGVDFFKNTAKRFIQDAITHLQAHPEEIYVSNETCFFQSASAMCVKMGDTALALEVDKFKVSLGNRHVQPNYTAGNIYYSNLFQLLSLSESLETILNIYNRSFGQQFSTSAIFVHILSAVEMYKEYHHVSKLFDDFLMRTNFFPNRSNSQDLVTLQVFLDIMALDNHSEELKDKFFQQTEKFYIMMKKEGERTMRERMSWNVAVTMIQIFLQNNELEPAWECLNFGIDRRMNFDRVSWDPKLQLLVDKVLEAKDVEKFKSLLEIVETQFNHKLDVIAFRLQLSAIMTSEEIKELIIKQRERARQKYRM